MYSKHLFSTDVSKTSINSQVHHERLFLNLLPKWESATSLAQDEDSDGEESSSSKVIIQEQSSFQFEGVRFTPKVIEFSDAFEGKQFRQTIKLQNVGRNPALVKIGEPNSFVFHMNKPERCVRFLPSGKTITRTLSYVYHNDDLVQRSQIRVQINGRAIDYPIVVKQAVPVIEVHPPELDFKIINMGASAKTLKMTLVNTGGRGTKFAIDLGRNELDLVVSPPRGTIRAKNEMVIYVEMVGINEGEFYKEMWITTNERSIRVPIIVEVLSPRLEASHPNSTGDFTLIDFPPTFIGTQRLDSFILRNFSADITFFVTLAEIGGELKSHDEARKIHESFRMFTLAAEEGRLEPFESRIVTVVFKPQRMKLTTGWHHKAKGARRSNEYLVFFRINRVHCIERKELEMSDIDANVIPLSRADSEPRHSISLAVASTMSVPVNGTSPTDSHLYMRQSVRSNGFASVLPIHSEFKHAVRLCLHGESVEPDLLVQPASLYFENTVSGSAETKVVKITNKSLISMKFKFHKTINVKVSPVEGWLKPENSIDITVIYKPTYPGVVNNSIKIEIFGKSAILYDSDKSLVSLKCFEIRWTATGLMPVGSPVDLGMTTRLPHGGKILSKLTANQNANKISSAAVLNALQQGKNPGWMIEEREKLKKVENALVAFRNDSRCLENQVSKSIFTEFLGSTPPVDDNYILTPEEFKKRRENYRIWREYLRLLPDFQQIKLSDGIVTEKLSDYDISCMKLFYQKELSSDNVEYKELVPCRYPSNNDSLLRVLIPLSPLLLLNVKVKPKLINFAMVAPNSSTYETLKLQNTNSFPVSIRFIPGKSGVTLPDGDTRIVPPLSKKLLKIVFKTRDFGRYNGFLEYVINGSHQFKIRVSANVVPKTLIVNEKDYNLEFGNFCPTAAFQPNSKCLSLINPLQSPIKFRWEMQSDSAFEIEPMTGEVPPRTVLMNQIYFNISPKKSYFSEANLISESGSKLPIKMCFRKSRSNIFFLANKIDLAEIPLNLPQIVCPTIRNESYSDAPFEILDWSPMPGIKISPKEGIIKARSTFDLLVEIQIPVLIQFQFEIRLRIHQGFVVSLKVSGSVVSPMIRVTPMDMTMRKVSAQSYDILAMCAHNVGKTPAYVLIDFKDYPEYKISRTKERLSNSSTTEGALLKPGKSVQFFIHFEPNDVARYQFYLPIIINGILGPPVMQDNATEYFRHYLEGNEGLYLGYGSIVSSGDLKAKIPCACINCTVSSRILKFSALEFKFHISNCCSAFQEEELEITNAHFSAIDFCVRTDDVNNQSTPFYFHLASSKCVEYRSESIKVHLAVGESISFKAGFRPLTHGHYSIEIPIFVRGYNDGYPYNFLRLSGDANKPKISSEANEIHFPPVPLRTGTDVTMKIYAERYTYPDVITCTVWKVEEYGKLISDSVKVVWLEEPKISGTSEVQVFSVQVCFQSSYPVSLRTFLVFSDSGKEYCPVLLTAITDNCSLTTHLFLTTRAYKYKFIREDTRERDFEEDSSPNYSFQKKLFVNGEKSDNFNKKIGYSKRSKLKGNNMNKSNDVFQSNVLVKVDMGPKLVIQMTKSMTRLTQLNFVSLKKPYDSFLKESTFTTVISSDAASHSDVINTTNASLSLKSTKRPPETDTDVTYPYFPTGEDQSNYEKHLHETLKYVELWVYEVVFHCEEYLSIPTSFQTMSNYYEANKKRKKTITKDNKMKSKKTVIDLIVELAGSEVREYFPKKPPPSGDSISRAEYLYSVFYCLLHFLRIQGSFLPHVQPENLLCYDDYVTFTSAHVLCETLKCGTGFPAMNPSRKMSSSIFSFSSKSVDREDLLGVDMSFGTLNETWIKSVNDEIFDDDVSEFRDQKRNVEIEDNFLSAQPGKRDVSEDCGIVKEYIFKHEKLDEQTFNLRSTQAWLDVLIQTFRTLVLPKIVIKEIRPSLTMAEVEEKFSSETLRSRSLSNPDVKRNRDSLPNLENNEGNTYTIQERILLHWLHHHYDLQRTILWPENSKPGMSSPAPPKNIDGFRSDLKDSLALMAVTASYCPYLIPSYFLDAFRVPENNEQLYHNAIQLTSSWRRINLGLTVEPRDVICGNKVFMIMIVSYLYETLPGLCPRSVIRFSAPLTEEMSRSIQLENTSDQKITYEARFIGHQECYFRLVNSEFIILKPRRKADLKIVFRARRINKVSVTLFLCGNSVSPHFTQSLVFQLEGESSALIESARIKLKGTLYKVNCMDVAIRPPYLEEAKYEISYSTISPNDSDQHLTFMKPWKEIWHKKTSRRLFLNQNEIYYDGFSPATLNITIACFTNAIRSFWLLFNGKQDVGDFIIRIDISSNSKGTVCGPIYVDLPESWSTDTECTCIDVERNLRFGMNASSICPLMTYIKIPSRNNSLWESMFLMFQKTLDAKEKPFWKKHFETNIGIRLIKWLLIQDESEEVADEFIPCLSTNVHYTLKFDHESKKYVNITHNIEIPDVRSRNPIYLPVHISNRAPSDLKMTLTMTSENKKEIRTVKYVFQKPEKDLSDIEKSRLEGKQWLCPVKN